MKNEMNGRRICFHQFWGRFRESLVDFIRFSYAMCRFLVSRVDLVATTGDPSYLLRSEHSFEAKSQIKRSSSEFSVDLPRDVFLYTRRSTEYHNGRRFVDG